jgi:hypothetical protein
LIAFERQHVICLLVDNLVSNFYAGIPLHQW